jgi:hypothetical protein
MAARLVVVAAARYRLRSGRVQPDLESDRDPQGVIVRGMAVSKARRSPLCSELPREMGSGTSGEVVSGHLRRHHLEHDGVLDP